MPEPTSEQIMSHSPEWVKRVYVNIIQLVKQFCKLTGILAILDKKAKTHRAYHYLRSLLAIYQLEDMITLDTPWWTYSAIEAIEKKLHAMRPPLKVFEYGSGASTLWFAKRHGHIISIEHDPYWYTQLKEKLIGNNQVELLCLKPERPSKNNKYHSSKMKDVSFETYVKVIEKYNTLFDIIVIDGRSRCACLEDSLPFLKPEGFIIFDNSNRKRYQQTLIQSGLRIKRYPGWVPSSPFKSETAILTRA